MKKLVTFRLDPGLLDQVRLKAQAENRSLTNYVETVLKRSVDGAGPQIASHARIARPTIKTPTDRPNMAKRTGL